MPHSSQAQAKRFFVDRIVAQAREEGSPLSDDEVWMLSFSESDPDFVVDPSRVERLSQEISDPEYEAKVAGLIKRAFEHDHRTDPRAADSYRAAYQELEKGDHYLSIMLSRTLARKLTPWWKFRF